MSTVPYTFQLKDARQTHRLDGRVLNASDMGLGKTLTTLLYCIRHPEVLPGIVICPASLKWQWEREAKFHVNLRSQVLDTRKAMIPHARGQIPPLTIINYDILGPWLKYLKSLNPKIIIVDECHALGDRTTQRSKNVKALCKGIPHTIFLSGTPATSRPVQLYVPLNIMRPDVFPNFMDYARHFCAPRKTPWGWDLRGASHLDELNSLLLSTCMIRRRKIDVLDQLPAKCRTVIPLDIEKRKEYEQAKHDLISWLAKNYGLDKAKRASRSEQLTRVGYLKRLAAELKVKQAFNWIDDFLVNSDEKLILFAWHHKIIDLLYDRYKKISVKAVTADDRKIVVEQFLSNRKTRLYIGNIQSSGVGWSAKGVSTVAFIELDWRPGFHQQAEDRVYGIGRGKEGSHSQIYYLIARDTIEEKLCWLLQKKETVLSKMFDGGPNEADLELFDELVKSLKN